MKRIRLYHFHSFLIALASLSMSLSLCAQDIHFSQFNESPLTLNPALCGAYNGQLLGIINYRNQWPTVAGAFDGYNTMEASVQLHNICSNWKKGYLSPGLSLFSDKSGNADIQANNIDFTLASGVYLSHNSSLSAGLQSGWAQNSISLQNIQWGDQVVNGEYNPNLPTGEPNTGYSHSYFDFSAGLYYHYKLGEQTMVASNHFLLNFGVAAFHVTEPNISYYHQSEQGTDLYMRIVFHGDAMFDIQTTNLSMVPSFMFLDQGPSKELDFGSKLRYKFQDESKYSGVNVSSTFDIGGYYRWNDAIIALVGFEKWPFAAYMSFDFNTSSLITATSGIGAFEISLIYLNPEPSGNNRPMF